MEFQTVVDAVRAWPTEDRVRLVDLIREDLRALPPNQVKEINRRLAAYDAGPSIGIPFDDFVKHIDNQVAGLGE